jgi:flagellar hook assembly protein FlgD
VLATGGMADDLVWYESDLVGVVENEISMPSRSDIIALYNQPNPFTRRTKFSFDIQEPLSLTLSIYNTSGQLVQTLTQAAQVGHIEMVWDRHDAQGDRVASGIYFYKVETATFNAYGHMCVID